jgi:hypothetical protein
MEADGNRWLGFGLSEKGRMTGSSGPPATRSRAFIGCEAWGVEYRELAAKSESTIEGGDAFFPENSDMEDALYTQSGGKSVMEFSMPLSELEFWANNGRGDTWVGLPSPPPSPPKKNFPIQDL